MFLLLLTACGVPDATLLSDLTDEQAKSLCLEDGAARTYSCEGEGFSYDITFGYEDESDCDDADSSGYGKSCDATVGDARACADAWEADLQDDPCATDTPAECTTLFKCIGM
jgi:hypothetical protein